MRRWGLSLTFLIFAAAIWLSFRYNSPKLESLSDQYLRHVSRGELRLVPFSEDLSLLGYSGAQFVGKLPALTLEPDEELYWSCWYDVYQKKNGKEELIESHAPKDIENSGGTLKSDDPIKVWIAFQRTGPESYAGRWRFLNSSSDFKFSVPENFTFCGGKFSNSVRVEAGKPIRVGAFDFCWTGHRDQDIEQRWFIQLAVRKKIPAAKP